MPITIQFFLKTAFQLASVGFCLLFLPLLVNAQNLTPEQVAQLQSLSPAQRAELVRQNQQAAPAAGAQQLAQPATTSPRQLNANNQQTGIEENAQRAQAAESLDEVIEEQVICAIATTIWL